MGRKFRVVGRAFRVCYGKKDQVREGGGGFGLSREFGLSEMRRKFCSVGLECPWLELASDLEMFGFEIRVMRCDRTFSRILPPEPRRRIPAREKEARADC